MYSGTAYRGCCVMDREPIGVNAGLARTVTDAELMNGIRADNHQALETLFRRYVRLVRSIAAGILKDRAEAEDVTQEIFYEIYRKAYLYDPARGSVRVWLLQYAYRRTVRRKAVLRRRAAYGAESIEAAESRVEVCRRRLTLDECRWVLRSGLEQLSRQQRTTLELTCFEDLTLRDVAERLGVSVGCTRHYYYRGLARLQRWAQITDPRAAAEARTASRAGKAGAAKGPGRRLYAHT